MITRISLENIIINNIKIENYKADFNKGLTVLDARTGNSLVDVLKYIIYGLRGRSIYSDDKFLNIGYIDPDELSTMIICCDSEYGNVEYNLSYGDGNIVTEYITIDNILVGYYDYYEDELTKGDYWSKFGNILGYDYNDCEIDTKLLFTTVAGGIIKESISHFIICRTDEWIENEYNNTFIYNRLYFGRKNRILEINKLLSEFYFDVKIDETDNLVYNKHPESPYGIHISSMGSGFNHILGIIPEILFGQETNSIVVIPNYESHLDYVRKEKLKIFLENCGISIIATTWI